MNSEAQPDPQHRPQKHSDGNEHTGVTIGVAGIFATVLVAIAQSASDPIIRTACFCFAAFCALQIPLLLLYARRAKKAIPLNVLPNALDVSPDTSRRVADLINSEPIYEPFSLSVGEFWERKIDAFMTIRVELNAVHEKERPAQWREEVQPCVDIRIDTGGNVFTQSPEAIEISTNCFTLFRTTSGVGSSAFSMGASEKRCWFVGVQLNHVNPHQKSARMMLIAFSR
jgi:hypothetical protein